MYGEVLKKKFKKMLKQTERDLNAELNEIIKKEKETNKQEIEKLIRENSITKGF